MTKEEVNELGALILDNLKFNNHRAKIVNKFIELSEETERLKAELNELKEKHKNDIEDAFNYAKSKMFSSNPNEAFMTGEQYYKQKFESND